MATLLKIRGLSRGKLTGNPSVATASDGSVASVRGFRIKHAVGRQFSYETGAVKASRTVGASNSAVTYTANYAGAWGNNVQVAHVLTTASGAAANVAFTYQSGTANPLITVNVATNVSGSNISTATAVAALVNADPNASQYVTAAAGGNGTGTVSTISASNLTSGSNGTTTDAEPPYNVAGEPIWVRVNNASLVVVDVDDQVTARTLMRNRWRYVSLGQP